jgi:SAM-dependent methyltransferase
MDTNVKLKMAEIFTFPKNNHILNQNNIMNKINYESLKKIKESVGYNTIYKSSAVDTTLATLGTIESDASGRYGKYEIEKFRGKKIFDILKTKNFKTILDVGAGKLEVVEELLKLNKTVDICEFENSWYLSNATVDAEKIRNIHIGDINTIDIKDRYDAIWAAHILEHQINPNIFLKKLYSLLNEGGYLTVIVPPRKPFIVGGHVSMWNGGLLLYHLILAGFDCSDAQLLQYDYNIGIIVKKKTINPYPKINYDLGDLNLLKNYFPIEICEGFNGDIMEINIK